MSETLIQNVLETNVSGSSAAGYINPEWHDDGLFNLVAANAAVRVRVERMGGIEMTLSEAMNLHPGPWTPENEPNLISEVHQLLANRVTETEEPAEQKESQQEAPAAREEAKVKSNSPAQEKTVPENPKKPDLDSQSKKAVKRAKQSNIPAGLAEKTPKTEGRSAAAADAAAAVKLAQREAVEFAQVAAKTRASASSSNSSADKASKGDRTAPKTYAAAPPLAEAKSATDRPKPAVNQKARSSALPVAIKSEPEELSPLNHDAPEQIDEKIQMPQEAPAPANIDYQIDLSYKTSLTEPDVLLIDHFEEAGPGTDGSDMSASRPNLDFIGEDLERPDAIIYQSGDPANLSEQTKTSSPEQRVQTNLTISQIEAGLNQLAEGIEASQVQTSEKLNVNLDKIIEIPAMLQADGIKNITEAPAQEELEELFTGLYEQLGIDGPPQLIESLAGLMLAPQLTADLQKRRAEEFDKAPQDSPTHEIITELLAGISPIKKAMARAGAIGRSALGSLVRLGAAETS